MRSPHAFRLILDTNTLLRGLANRNSASGRVLELCEQRRVVLLLSRVVISEYRTVLASPDVLHRNPDITSETVELVLRRLRYLSDYTGRVHVRFQFDRDPLDEKFIELAIAASASHIVTNDNDLLSLPSDHSVSAKRFRQRLPTVNVLRPVEFMREFENFIATG